MRISKQPTAIIATFLLVLVFLLTGDDKLTAQLTDIFRSEGILGTIDTSTTLVTRIIDGDTLELATGEKVRLIGIDAPEKKGEECFALESQLKLSELTLGQEVILEKDRSDTDRYGRLLRYIWVGETMINLELVKEGYAVAKAYPPDTRHQPLFQQAQHHAQTNHAGLWGKCQQ